jgi:hypothetical protein
MEHVRERLFTLLNKLFELPSNTLTGEELLDGSHLDISWSSIELIGFIAMCDEQFNVIVPAQQLMQAKTVMDLIFLVENNLLSTTIV